jgi:hypothetical protein
MHVFDDVYSSLPCGDNESWTAGPGALGLSMNIFDQSVIDFQREQIIAC